MAERQGYLFPHQPVQQVGEVRQCIAHIQRFGPQGLLARECQKLPHQRRGSVGILVDLHQVGIILVTLIVPEQQEIAMA